MVSVPLQCGLPCISGVMTFPVPCFQKTCQACLIYHKKLCNVGASYRLVVTRLPALSWFPYISFIRLLMLRQEALQKQAVEALMLSRDAKHSRITEQIVAIEAELTRLSVVEIAQRMLQADLETVSVLI